MSKNLILLVNLSIIFVVGLGDQDFRNPEVVALVTLKSLWKSTSSDFLSSWDQYGSDPCNFAHVTCDANMSVARLELPNQRITGVLSTFIGNLSNLQYLTLQNNNLSGSIPDVFSHLGRLETLDLSHNNFTGSIPPSLGDLSSAMKLMLDYNKLDGTIPETLTALTSLKLLDLSYNNLSGLVPNISVTSFNLEGNVLLCGAQVSRDCPGEPPMPLVLFNTSKNTSSSSYNKGALVSGLSVGAALLIASLAFGVAWWRRHDVKQVFFDVNEQENCHMTLGQLKRFPFRELQIATNNFDSSNILGKGGFGNVYKGVLADGSIVAVKRLREERTPGGEIQFQMEVELISLAVHRNLLRLRGFCMTPTERLLVYPFMSNGSVASRLRDDSSIFKKAVLDWPTRKRIALGSARGLVYLHEHCDPKIIHRDVKAANVLLDEDFEAVVGDFGLAKLLDQRDSHITTTVRGTVGHIAPEYLSTGQSSEKTDVFGYGILLLELITGQRAFDFGRATSKEDVVLLDWVKNLQREKRLDVLLDVDLKQNYSQQELEEMVQVALLCTQVSPHDRPKMAEVVRMLEGDGLAERWETWRRSQSRRGSDFMPRKYYEPIEDSTFDLESVELSGPR